MNDQDEQLVAHRSLATICANHTRRVQLLALEFFSGQLSMQQYRRRSRELTQQLVDQLGEASIVQPIHRVKQ